MAKNRFDQIQDLVEDWELAARICREKGIDVDPNESDTFYAWTVRAEHAVKGSDEQMKYILEMDKRAVSFEDKEAICSLTKPSQEIYKKQVREMRPLAKTHPQLRTFIDKVSVDSLEYNAALDEMFLTAGSHGEWYANLKYSNTPEKRKIALNEMFLRAVNHQEWLLNTVASQKGSPEWSFSCTKMFESAETLDDCLVDCHFSTENSKAMETTINKAFKLATDFKGYRKISEAVKSKPHYRRRAIAKMVEIGTAHDWIYELEHIRYDDVWASFCLGQVSIIGTFDEIYGSYRRIIGFDIKEKMLYALVAKATDVKQKSKLYGITTQHPELKEKLFGEILSMID